MGKRKVKQIPAFLTPNQLLAVSMAAERAGVGVSKFVRDYLKTAVELHGVEWPDEEVKHGDPARFTPKSGGYG